MMIQYKNDESISKKKWWIHFQKKNDESISNKIAREEGNDSLGSADPSKPGGILSGKNTPKEKYP